MAYQNAIKNDSIWSRDNKCELTTYIPNYRPYGGIGRVLRLFSNQSFFVVYDAHGNKIKVLHGIFGKLSSLIRLHQNGTGNMQCIPQAKGGQDGKFQSVVNV